MSAWTVIFACALACIVLVKIDEAIDRWAKK